MPSKIIPGNEKHFDGFHPLLRVTNSNVVCLSRMESGYCRAFDLIRNVFNDFACGDDANRVIIDRLSITDRDVPVQLNENHEH